MTNSNEPEVPKKPSGFDKQLKLLMRNPIKGSKAAGIIVFLTLGAGLFPFVYYKLDWNASDPFLSVILYISAVILFLLGTRFLISTCVKYDHLT